MTLYDELVARGLIAQVTDEEEIKELINNGKAVFYIGFDPTADSLHVGHFMALCLMKRLQMAGNKPIGIVYQHCLAFSEIDETAHLLFETVYVVLNGLRCHHQTHIGTSGRITDHGCTAADQRDWLVS